MKFPFGDGVVGFWNVHDVRLVRGSWTEPGPGIAWFRLLCPVIAGEPISPIARVAAAADFGSGVSNPVRMTKAAAINPELTVHVHRHPAGEWVCLESGAWAQPHGVGMAETRSARRAGRDRSRGAVAARRAGDTPRHGSLRGLSRRAAGPVGQSSSDLRSTSVAQSSNSPLRKTSAAGRPASGRAEIAAAAVDAHRDGAPARRGEDRHPVGAAPLERGRRHRERLVLGEALLLAGAAPQRLLDTVGDRAHQAVGQLGPLDLAP